LIVGAGECYFSGTCIKDNLVAVNGYVSCKSIVAGVGYLNILASGGIEGGICVVGVG
jgi:hypothetical protein